MPALEKLDRLSASPLSAGVISHIHLSERVRSRSPDALREPCRVGMLSVESPSAVSGESRIGNRRYGRLTIVAVGLRSQSPHNS